jgi:hypothetical protein
MARQPAEVWSTDFSTLLYTIPTNHSMRVHDADRVINPDGSISYWYYGHDGNHGPDDAHHVDGLAEIDDFYLC